MLKMEHNKYGKCELYWLHHLDQDTQKSETPQRIEQKR